MQRNTSGPFIKGEAQTAPPGGGEHFKSSYQIVGADCEHISLYFSTANARGYRFRSALAKTLSQFRSENDGWGGVVGGGGVGLMLVCGQGNIIIAATANCTFYDANGCDSPQTDLL